MKREKRGFLAVLILITLAGCHSGVATSKAKSLVDKVTHGQASVRTIFDGPPGSGLTGAVIAGGNHSPVVVWITADGKTLIAGNVFDAKGRNLTQMATFRLAEAPSPGTGGIPIPSAPVASSPSQTGPVALAPGVFRTVAGSVHVLREGTGSRTLWIFLDPDCIWCHRLYTGLKAHPLPAGVAVNWVPVAFLRPSSVGRAETLLSGGLPALDKDETRFDETTEEGGVSQTHRPDLEAAVRNNTRILVSLGGTMTPTVVFRNKTGGTLRFDGFPTTEILDRIAGEAK